MGGKPAPESGFPAPVRWASAFRRRGGAAARRRGGATSTSCRRSASGLLVAAGVGAPGAGYGGDAGVGVVDDADEFPFVHERDGDGGAVLVLPKEAAAPVGRRRATLEGNGFEALGGAVFVLPLDVDGLVYVGARHDGELGLGRIERRCLRGVDEPELPGADEIFQLGHGLLLYGSHGYCREGGFYLTRARGGSTPIAFDDEAGPEARLPPRPRPQLGDLRFAQGRGGRLAVFEHGAIEAGHEVRGGAVLLRPEAGGDGFGAGVEEAAD